MRRHSFGSALRVIAREAARAERAHIAEAKRQVAARERQRRNAERQAKADVREAAKLYLEERLQEAEDLSNEVLATEREILNLLADALRNQDFFDPLNELQTFSPRTFDDAEWRSLQPKFSSYLPQKPSFFQGLMPGSKARYETACVAAKMKFDAATLEHEKIISLRDAAFEAFQQSERARQQEVSIFNQKVHIRNENLQKGQHTAVVESYTKLLSKTFVHEVDATSAEVGYASESRHMVVDIELPELEMIPNESSFKYVRSGDKIEAVRRSIAKRRALYSHLLSQIILKCIDSIFRGGVKSIVDCLTVNGMLETINPATGAQVRLCLISVRVTEDLFKNLNLALVNPEECLKALKASVSRAPSELVPVKPIIELDMVDPRFVETTDVLSTLDQRLNLMELSPTEFEALITNLFAEIGLDTRQTRPSRDGGVDCVAFDPRPIFGGKVVIQAKRYKNTVGVSAVRDLFGTVQNEGASKGILVTTSGYGKAAYEFANGKPLELLDGGNLLHLLVEHAKIEARIEVPDGWKDLPVHGE